MDLSASCPSAAGRHQKQKPNQKPTSFAFPSIYKVDSLPIPLLVGFWFGFCFWCLCVLSRLFPPSPVFVLLRPHPPLSLSSLSLFFLSSAPLGFMIIFSGFILLFIGYSMLYFMYVPNSQKQDSGHVIDFKFLYSWPAFVCSWDPLSMRATRPEGKRV